ncbi:uncharacterized protein LOC128558914 [Mercenaria mercenaria]|uniref:uncharacterized protein LOC128558914 n=1 Tax=Mercenaria mercenaria TaxID=6596 RepID=UPI00234ED6FC|nr:uncharacterized protein LOC128558914 [Mercenaria mercenaria]
MPRLKKKSYLQKQSSNKDAMRASRDAHQHNDGLNFPKKCDGLNFPKKSDGLNFPKKSENGLNFPKKSENGLNFPKKSEGSPEVSKACQKNSESLLKDFKSFAEELQKELPDDLPSASCVQTVSPESFTGYESNIIHDSTNPFRFVSLMYGSFHQGDDRFSWDSRGSQCTINSLCALKFSQYFEFSSQESLDDILTVGDQLYKNVVRNLRQLGNFKHRLLCLDEMPDEVNIKCKKIHIEKGNIVSGNAVTQFGSSILPALHQSLYNVLQSANHVLIMIGAICSAVFFKDGLYWFFDSHSHGSDGLSHSDGRSVLLSFSCLDDLVSYMYALYNSMNIDLLSQYELMPLKFSFLISDEFLIAEHDSKFRKAEKEKNKAAKQKSRLDEQVKNKERVAKKLTRDDIDYRQAEKDRDRVARQKSRLDIDNRQAENERDKAARQKSRLDEQVKNKERVAKKLTRDDIDYRQAENERDKAARQKSRLDEQVKNKERVAKKLTRDDFDYRQAEKSRDKVARQKCRHDIDYRLAENERNREAKRLMRKNDYVLEKERISKHESRRKKQTEDRERVLDRNRKASKRKEPDYRESEIQNAKQRKYGNSVDDCIRLFHRSIETGPQYICSCCQQTWFKESLRELPRGRQYSLKGNVVNVPVEIQPVVDVLPRPLDENVTVPVKLKKKLSHKSCAFTENIRPLRVLVALHWLLRHSKLYTNANVQIDEQWIEQVTQHSNEVLQEFLSADTESNSKNSQVNIAHEEKEQGIEQKGSELYDSDAEENIHLQENVGNIDTLVDYENLENRSNVLTFAPGENQRPLSIYQDKDSEYLCFPTIFCGQTRQENEERLVSVHYSDIAKWELRHFDRRAANSVPNIFFKLKKIQMKQVNDKVNLAVRRCQIDGRKITASQARDVNCTEEIVKKDQGYYIFKQLRNSPAYLETKKKDVFAMLRQLGMPTWFLSLSSADTRWSDLLKMLASLNSDVEYTDNDIRNLSWEQKVKLIQKDPVTCSRYFDHRVQQFIKLVLKSTHNPLGVISDYFYRVEFQQRGSPHIHMIAWVQNSPKYNECSVSEITAYVDQYLKSSSDNADMTDLIQLQIHQHSRSCKKKDVRKCRFGFPLPPLPETMVLEPLESDVDKYKKLYEKIQEKMNKEKDGFDMSYKHFLTDIVQLSEQDYIKCIRSTLNTPKVFLKREPKDIRLNLYNETVLRAWKANIDIQFILDPYACAMYIVSYISKSQRGMSSLMHAACKEARNGNLDLKRQVRHIGNVFSNSVEVSAQEAVYLVLQMSLTRSTRDVTFINTSAPEKRIHLLKSKTVLDEMPDNSTDVIAENAIKRYSKRPKKLENWCLADYVSKLDIVFPKNEHLSDSVENVNDDYNESDDDGLKLENLNDSQTISYFKNGGQIRIRKNARVIRYGRYNLKSDEENHFREKLLLFLPWRNEVLDLLANYESYKDHYLAIKAKIDCKCMEYEHHAEQIEIAREMAEVDEEIFDEIAPGTQQTEVDTAAEEVVESEAFVYFNPDRVAEHRHYDIGIELGSACSNARVESNEILLPEEEYLELLRCLNTNQRRFYNHVIHWIKTKTEPLYAYLSGGAGVGKSVVIKAIFQTLYRFLNLREGQNSDETRILLCAFTGKAAFNINGSTIAKAFFEGYMQSNQQLTCERLNTFRSKYRELSVIIIDEISMVSKVKLSFIDQRLQQLTGTNKAFGGLSIIAVGDLYQLQPVTGGWIFKDLDRGASALSRNLWKDHFRMYELTEIMRQKDDISFAELLNRLRHNALTDVDRAELKKREVKQYSEQHPLHAPHIFAESTFMNLHNQEIIRRKQTQHITVNSLDVVMSPKLSKDKQERTLRSLPDDHNKTGMLFRLLPIVVDMVYDLTVNLNTADGLTNGASCRIQFVEYRQVETDRPSIIWVLFDDPKVGTEQRQKYKTEDFTVARYMIAGHLYLMLTGHFHTIEKLFREYSFHYSQLLEELFIELKDVHLMRLWSLHKHFEHVKADQNVLSAHIIGLAETRLCQTGLYDEYAIEGFHLLRNDQLTGCMQKGRLMV